MGKQFTQGHKANQFTERDSNPGLSDTGADILHTLLSRLCHQHPP